MRIITRRRALVATVVFVVFAVAVVVAGVIATHSRSHGAPTGAHVTSYDTVAAERELQLKEADASGGGMTGVAPLDASTSGVGQPSEPNSALPPTTLDPGRFLVRTGDLTVYVGKGDVPGAAAQVTSLTSGFGGYVLNSQMSTSVDDQKPYAAITVRVPARSYEAAIARFGELGEVKSLNTGTDDVTGQVVDIQARLKHYRAVERRLLSFLQKATSVDEALNVQERIDATQLQVEELEAQMKSLREQTSYGTLTVSITEKPKDVTPAKDRNEFLQTLVDSGNLIVAGFEAILLAIAALLPFLAVFGGLGYVLYRTARRAAHHRRQVRPEQ